MTIIEKAARVILKKCLNIQEGETLLVVSDQNHSQLSLAIMAESQKLKIQRAFIEVALESQYHQEPDEFIWKILSVADVVIILTRYPLSRSYACQVAGANQTRLLYLVNTKSDMLRRIVETRYQDVQAITQKLADILTIGSNLTLKTTSGSDLHLSLSKVKGFAGIGMIHKPGEISSLPAGEAYCTPVLDSASGELIIDGSVELIGPVKNPIRLKISGGQIRRISGQEEAANLRKQIKRFGSKARQIIGLGIGTNETAQFNISTDEDKKVLGSAHITFGNTFPFDRSGRIPNRIDAIVKKPTLIIDGTKIIDNGNLAFMYH